MVKRKFGKISKSQNIMKVIVDINKSTRKRFKKSLVNKYQNLPEEERKFNRTFNQLLSLAFQDSITLDIEFCIL